MRLIFTILNLVIAINHEQRLVSRLLKNYNREIRPIRNVSEVIHVRFYMTLQQMISVVEKVFLYISLEGFVGVFCRIEFVNFKLI